MAQTVKNPLATQELQETWVPSLCWGDPLEEGMATHSSILACRIPWTEELGGLFLQSTGSRASGLPHLWRLGLAAGWLAGSSRIRDETCVLR